MTESKVLVCHRMADLIQPPAKSVARACGICGAPIWVALSSPDADEFRCIPCVLAEPGEIEFEPLTPRQIADIRGRLP
jgi:hypothetical protein